MKQTWRWFGPRDLIPIPHIRQARGRGDCLGIAPYEKRRRDEGRPDHQIPMRPDHGQDIVFDLGRNGGQPGYPAVGRLKGLAELRGIMSALQHSNVEVTL